MKRTDIVNCFGCGKKQLSDDEIGLNRKMLGRSIRKIYCWECLAGYLDATIDELLAKVEEFREQGCTLFSG